MSRWRIYVESTEIDVPNDLSAQFTYAIDDIKDFASRNTNFSKTVVLPGTSRNNKAFGHIFEIGSGNFYNDALPNIGYNFNAGVSAKCLATQDGIPVFKGVLRLLEIVIDGSKVEYETALFGELGGLVAAMGDKRLEDLDFSAYNHTFNLANISASQATAPGSGYYYPLIDYGYTINGVDFPIETFRPAYYAKEYLDKIFSNAGYTYESDFLETDYFKKLIIPFNGLYPTIEVPTILHVTDVTATITNNSAYLPFDTQVGTSYIFSTSTHQRFIWRRQEKVSALFTFTCNYSTTGGLGAVVLVIKNGDLANPVAGGQNGAASGTITFEQIVDMDYLDYFEVIFQPAGIIGTTTVTSSVFKIVGQPNIKIPLASGDSIAANDMIPKNVLQKDFLTWIIKMFNLYLDEDNVIEKHLRIEPFYQYYDTTSPLNWDSKLDRSQAIRIKPMGELNARTYEYKYKDDSDYYNDTYKKKYGVSYGSYTFDSGYEFIKDKQTVEVGFSPTVLVGYSGTDRVLSAIVKKTETSQERTASNIRILHRAEANIPCTDYKVGYWNGSTFTITHLTDYAYAGHLDDPDAPTTDLCFGVPSEFYFTILTGYLSANLFNVFWSFYISEITDKDSKVLTGNFRLTPVDIYNLDFAKLIFLNGTLWRLNSVVDYSTDQPDTTKVELLKVIDITE